MKLNIRGMIDSDSFTDSETNDTENELKFITLNFKFIVPCLSSWNTNAVCSRLPRHLCLLHHEPQWSPWHRRPHDQLERCCISRLPGQVRPLRWKICLLSCTWFDNIN